MFCEKGPIWSNDSGVVYAQGILGEFYAHERCLHADNIACMAYGSLRGKKEIPDWSRSKLEGRTVQVANGVSSMVPILTAPAFREYAKGVIIDAD